MFQSKEIDAGYSLPPLVHVFYSSKVGLGQKVALRRHQGLQPLPISLAGVAQAPPLWIHPDGRDFIRGTSIKAKPKVMQERKITEVQALLLKSLWTPVDLPNHNNQYTPWPPNCQPVQVFCGEHASLLLPNDKIKPLLHALQQKLGLDPAHAELELNEILASHADPRYKEWKKIVMSHSKWQDNPAKVDAVEVQCIGLGGAELDASWDVLVACKRHAQVYGPSLSKQDDWIDKGATVAGTAHTQEYLLLHLAVLPIGLHAWHRVLGVPTEPQIQAQIFARVAKLLEFCPITPAHRKPPHPGYIQSLRLFTRLLVDSPLRGVNMPLHLRIGNTMETEHLTGALNVKGHSAGSYAGMVLETVLQEFPHITGKTVLAAIALPPNLLINYKPTEGRTVRLIHHVDLCVGATQASAKTIGAS